MWFITSAVVVQLIFLLSVFDIHFHSPVIHGMVPHSSPVESPANRLVLISVDGLRFDTFLSHGNDREPNAPHMRSIASTRGCWGLSSTRVPTESRPGHVAMIAGLYEDPSAVFRGWKENPVEFDSIFNQSSATFGWGSPDILPMFAKGTKQNVFINTYSAESEQFTGHNAYKLDEWVFDKFEFFIKSAEQNSTIASMINKRKIVFFLHLLGMDTNGHTNKPHSELYMDNLRFVDKGIAKVETLINGYFKDNKTAFIFTSDHGMTDWGSHGAGHPTETRTPIVAWGAGIIKKNTDPTQWQFNREDVEQADITPLMASLLGINFPVNSVGKLPLSYLSDDFKAWKAYSALTNAKQLREMFQVLSLKYKERSLSWRFRPFVPLESTNHGFDFLEQIETTLRSSRFYEAMRLSVELMDMCLKGMDHFYRYDEFQLKLCITLAYVGWTGILAVFLIQDKHTSSKRKCSFKFKAIDQIAFVLAIVIFAVLTLEREPILYYAYHLLPLVLWWYCLRQWRLLRHVSKDLRPRYALWTSLLLIGIELLVGGFFHRWLLSVAMLFLSVWPHWSQPQTRWQYHEAVKMVWTFSFLILAFFPILPPVGKHNIPALVDVAGMALTIASIWASLLMHHDRDRTILVSYTLTIPVAIYIRHSVSDSLIQGQGLPGLEQFFSWILLCLPLTLPLVGPTNVWPRLIGIVITMTPSFMLLSMSYEVVFFAVLLIALAAWIKLESYVSTVTSTWTQLRRSFVFLLLTLLSFFGLGNLASVNSFDPSCVRCFVTTFSPFIMAALLMWKIIVPFITVSTALWAITVQQQIVSMRGLYLMILLLTSLMGVQFFHWVTSKGSWLDIGTSLSHYVIVQLMVLIVVVLRSVVQFFTYGPKYFRVPSGKYEKD